MATITISTNGRSSGREVHAVEGIDHSVRFGRQTNDNVEGRIEVASIALTPDQALGIAIDLLMQVVDAGLLKGWKIDMPERP